MLVSAFGQFHFVVDVFCLSTVCVWPSPSHWHDRLYIANRPIGSLPKFLAPALYRIRTVSSNAKQRNDDTKQKSHVLAHIKFVGIVYPSKIKFANLKYTFAQIRRWH